MGYNPFIKAKPIWSEGEETKKNITLGLYAEFNDIGERVVLRVTTAGFYRVFVDGKFFYYGPARCAKGFYRVDEICIPVRNKKARVAIEVVNYYVGSFNSIRQPGFIQAELVSEDKILAATGNTGFSYIRLTDRVRYLQRYSYQRPFAESYRLCNEVYKWREGKNGRNAKPVGMEIVSEKQFVPRNLMPSQFPFTSVDRSIARGTVLCNVKPKTYIKDRSLVNVKEPPQKTPEGFPEVELEWHLTDAIQEIVNTSYEETGFPYAGNLELESRQFEILSFPCEKSGFIYTDIVCRQPGTIYLLFDEILRGGDVDPLRMYCCNVIRLDMEEGHYQFQTMEPFGMQYIKLVCVSGSHIVRELGVREVICSQPIDKAYSGRDLELKRIYDAALETFKQNSCDIFMDCPTRERAGWLCDSYFMAKSEYYFTGSNAIEHNFLENYLLPESFSDVPKGMVPMCYPADSWTHNYIPNWAMWFVLELEDYKKRSGDTELIEKLKKRVYGIVDWFADFENQDGLLEKLPGWVFIEWSKANEFVQDINFPTNMLYAYMLEVVGNLYQDDTCFEKSKKLKILIRKRSYLEGFFCDNEVYHGGEAKLSGERSETCQYYAFFTGIATPEMYPKLWETMVTSFGPYRETMGIYQDIYPSNAFIGHFLRLILLHRYGKSQQMLEEIKGYFLYMADRTGTLWEKKSELESCNHGFASYVAILIDEAEKEGAEKKYAGTLGKE